MRHHIYLILHLLAAAIWVGGHLILCIRVLPKALKMKDMTPINNFKTVYEPIGLPSLLILLVTGILMAYDYDATFTKWFSFSGAIEKIVSIKLVLLLSTAALAISAQRFESRKRSANTLNAFAFHIIAVTVIGVTMVILGSFVRFGGI